MATPKSKPQTQKSTPSGAPAGAEDIRGLRINYGGCSVPIILSRVYKYAAFDRPMKFKVDGKQQDIDVASKVGAAWSLVWERANHATCNSYFKTLVNRKSLKEILQEGGLTLHMLVPKQDDTSYDQLPAGNSAGHDIGIHPYYLLDEKPGPLACTLIHELAHVAGATGNKRDEKAADAENALKFCGCKNDHDDKIKG